MDWSDAHICSIIHLRDPYDARWVFMTACCYSDQHLAEAQQIYWSKIQLFQANISKGSCEQLACARPARPLAGRAAATW